MSKRMSTPVLAIFILLAFAVSWLSVLWAGNDFFGTRWGITSPSLILPAILLTAASAIVWGREWPWRGKIQWPYTLGRWAIWYASLLVVTLLGVGLDF